MASIIQSKLNLVPGAAPGGILPRVRVSQGDAEDRILQFELFDGTTAADMTDVVDCYIGGTKPDGNGFTVSCTLASNVATAVLTDQATVLAGSIRCKLYLLSAAGSVRSASFEFDVDPDPLADAGTSDTDITAIVQAASMYARNAEESAAAAAESEAGAATAGATAGQAAAQAVVLGKLDKVGGDSKDVVTTFTSQDNAADTGLITASGQEVSVATMASGETQSSLFNKATGLALNLRRTINAVKAIWTGVSDDWNQNGHSYSVFDMVWYGTHLYKCKLAHTSSASITPLDTTYWEDTTVTRELTSLNSNYANINDNYSYTSGTTNFPAAGTIYEIHSFKATLKGRYLLIFDIAGTYNSSVFLQVAKENTVITGNTAQWTGSPCAQSAAVIDLNINQLVKFKAACSVATNTNDRAWHLQILLLKKL